VVPFALVDVFTDVPLAGNPLAVVPHVPELDESALPRLAREFNQSETTFLFPPTRPTADWRLRSFTPAGVEVFGAGHNALGAWWWLAATRRIELAAPANEFFQELGDRVLPLTIHRTANGPSAIAMKQSAPRYGPVVTDRAVLADTLGLNADDIVDRVLPAQIVATDVAHLLVPVRRDALSRVHPAPDRLAALVSSMGGEGCYVFTLDARDSSAVADARFFNPGVGIAEDPATGTAAGPLAAALVRHGLTSGPRVIIDQGLETGRPSRLEIHVVGESVELRGAAVVAAEGAIRVR
jgi:trans-2,3-dihydro-3-hydroxyanthranilate isomerase